MGILELIGGVIEFWCSWRFYLCALVSAAFAIVLHDRFQEGLWPWFLSVPAIVAGFVGGWWWQLRADCRKKDDHNR